MSIPTIRRLFWIRYGFLLGLWALGSPSTEATQSNRGTSGNRAAQGGAAVEQSPGVPGALEIDRLRVNFGQAYQFETFRDVLEVSNPGNSSVRIVELFDLAGTAELDSDCDVLAPGGACRVTIVQPFANRLGRVTYRYAIVTDESADRRYRITVSGFVQSAYDPELPTLDFEVVSPASDREATAELASREVDALQIHGFGKLPDYMTVEVIGRNGIAEEGVLLKGSLSNQAPLGLLAGEIEVETNVPNQPKILLGYRAQHYGDVVPSENPLDLGASRVGEVARGSFRLQSESGNPFVIGKLVDEAGDALLDVESCDGFEGSSDCYLVNLELAVDSEGAFNGAVLLTVDGDPRPVSLRYRGVTLTQGTRIRKLQAPDGGSESNRP